MTKTAENFPVLPFTNKQNHLGLEVRKLKEFFATENQAKLEDPHRPNFYVILFIIQGEGVHKVNFQSFSYKPGSLLFIAKRQVHKFIVNSGVDGYLLLFDEAFLSQNQLTYNDLSYSYPFNFSLYRAVLDTGDSKNTFLSLLDYVYAEYQSPIGTNSEELMQCLLRVMLLKIKSLGLANETNESNADSKNTQLFIRFQMLLDRAIDQKRNANFFCSELRVSFKRLNAISKKLTGNTLKKYIDQTIILKAKQDLAFQDFNVSEIALKLGFQETTNFTKFFKKHTGLNPSEFQKIR